MEISARSPEVQGEYGWHDADQDQHDEPHAFLTVVRAMREANAGTRQHQQAANPIGGGLSPSGGL